MSVPPTTRNSGSEGAEGVGAGLRKSPSDEVAVFGSDEAAGFGSVLATGGMLRTRGGGAGRPAKGSGGGVSVGSVATCSTGRGDVGLGAADGRRGAAGACCEL